MNSAADRLDAVAPRGARRIVSVALGVAARAIVGACLWPALAHAATPSPSPSPSPSPTRTPFPYPTVSPTPYPAFANWENAPVHPVAVADDGRRLLVCNLPDARLEVFRIDDPADPASLPVHVGSVPVGLDPVSVRARFDAATGRWQAWVANHVSDTVTVVELAPEPGDVPAGVALAALATADEPSDVAFAGGFEDAGGGLVPELAFVSCSQANRVQVFDPADLSLPPVEVLVAGEDPRALAVSPDGRRVYVAIFESGNATTILSGEDGSQHLDNGLFKPPGSDWDAVNHPDGPYGGVNPPPNAGTVFDGATGRWTRISPDPVNLVDFAGPIASADYAPPLDPEYFFAPTIGRDGVFAGLPTPTPPGPQSSSFVLPNEPAGGGAGASAASEIEPGAAGYGAGEAGPHGGIASVAPGAVRLPLPPQPPDTVPPKVALIVRKDRDGVWRDDNGANWNEFVSPAAEPRKGDRSVGWDLPDRDVAAIDVAAKHVPSADVPSEPVEPDAYVRGLMNVCMDLAVAPGGDLFVVGTEAINHVRFEANVRGRFVRQVVARVPGGDPGATPEIRDLNPHLVAGGAPADDPAHSLEPYVAPESVAFADRLRSVADPRGVAALPGGTILVAGMGSDNVAAFDAEGRRVGSTLDLAIPAGAGPVGLAAFSGAAGVERVYALNRFAATIAVLDVSDPLAPALVATVPLPHDATPPEIRDGRRFLYGARDFSGTGHLSCASCHIDARTDRLAWDLGDPSGGLRRMNEDLNGDGTLDPGEDFDGNGHLDVLSTAIGPEEYLHPMKGPMLTQTLQDIVGKEPFHWRGDRFGLEEFSGAYESLMGLNATAPAPPERQIVPSRHGGMQAFERFLATIRIPGNPYRNADNSLPRALPLDGFLDPDGTPIGSGVGDALKGLHAFVSPGELMCTSCHTLPTGMGWLKTAIPPDAEAGFGEAHVFFNHHDNGLALRAGDDRKVPHLRTLHERTGFQKRDAEGRAGFGFRHDGVIDSLGHIDVVNPAFYDGADLPSPPFAPGEKAFDEDLVAFFLALPGSNLGRMHDLNFPSATSGGEGPLPPTSIDTHAAAGMQFVFNPSVAASAAIPPWPESVPTPAAPSGPVDRLAFMIAEASVPDPLPLWHPDANPGPRVDLAMKLLPAIDGEDWRGYVFVPGPEGGRFYADGCEAPGGVAESEIRAGLAAFARSAIFTLAPRGSAIRLGIDRDGDGFGDREERAASPPTDPHDAASRPPGVSCIPILAGGGTPSPTPSPSPSPTPSARAVDHILGRTAALPAMDRNGDGTIDAADLASP